MGVVEASAFAVLVDGAVGTAEHAAASARVEGEESLRDRAAMQGWIDYLQREMDALAGVDFVQGDFTEQEVFDQLLEKLGEERADLVISDMAPNMSGVHAVDQPASMYLVELAIDFADKVLDDGGSLLFKAFQGEGFDAALGSVRLKYDKVLIRKPKASRSRSREVYVLAQGRRGRDVS